ncbi:Rid family hydrolase [Actinomycetospora lutea]|uniref:RidA family protein n=1 Tax=Actinomycetospora lutea TaxID=663604 RepID=UPI0023672A7B|nr:Rid family hydrolase [Actinomycetospora lutea]MDD7941567.1 Rid family hydrolase [Actinomycetospora lutea]
MSTPHQSISPWTWQDQFGFAQAVAAAPPSRWVFCSGQASSGPEGDTLHVGDMRAQVAQAFDNLEAVLEKAGADMSQVVRLNYFTTDADALLGAWDLVVERLGKAGIQPASTLLGVARLAFPDMLVEIEATALVP